MKRKELLKQAHYAFQRGNRELARRLLAELLEEHPGDEAAWMLMARVVSSREKRIQCYERVVKINPRNREAGIELRRLQSPGYVFEPGAVKKPSKGLGTFTRPAFFTLASVLVFASATFVLAKTDPGSALAGLLQPVFAAELSDPVAGGAAAKVRGKDPQGAAFFDALIGLAADSASWGMEGAPARPGPQITVSQQVGDEARAMLASAVPQTGFTSSVTLSQGQITSWLATAMQNSPDLPLKDIQVYFLDDQFQLWGIIENGTGSTSALVTGTMRAGQSGSAEIRIEAIQIGTTEVPSLLLSQAESWLNQLIADSIQSQAPGLRIKQVILGNGAITLTGAR